MKNINITYGWLLLFGIVVGCSVDKAPAVKKEAPQINSAPYLLAAEPEDGLGVSAARKAVKDQDAVVVIGRIGGSLNPWVDNRVAFQIVDPSLPSCSDCKEGNPAAVKRLGTIAVKPINYRMPWRSSNLLTKREM